MSFSISTKQRSNKIRKTYVYMDPVFFHSQLHYCLTKDLTWKEKKIIKVWRVNPILNLLVSQIKEFPPWYIIPQSPVNAFK